MQFRAYRVPGLGTVLDLQSDVVDTPVRIVASLLPLGPTLVPFSVLEPILKVGGEAHVLRTGELFTLPSRLLSGTPAADLSGEDYAIRRALDMLFSGF